MNRDSDIPNEILLRLLLESFSADDSPSGDVPYPSPSTVPQPHGAGGLGQSSPRPREGGLNIDIDVSYPIDADPTAVFDPGDVPVVQTHFEALLKRRLKQEIAQRPPLFPWEKGLQDYPDAVSPNAALTWLEHLRNLEIPTEIPDDVLTNLLNQCQRVAQITQQTGRRLVDAVDSLFPNQTQVLESMAGLVLRPTTRSVADPLTDIDYDSASPRQQVILSMMAAQKIFEALSINVSPTQPTVQRHWLTAEGEVTVQVTYQPGTPSHLEVRAYLPGAGRLGVGPQPALLHSERDTPGEVVVYLNQPQWDSLYTLTVTLTDQGADPLQFVVTLSEAGYQ